MSTHAEKNRGRRVLFPLKRANIAAFGLCDRAPTLTALRFGSRFVGCPTNDAGQISFLFTLNNKVASHLPGERGLQV
jgi:hypothetical protein